MGMDEVLRALGDPTRREMLRLLRQGDLTAGELAERFSLARSTLSEHCGVLRDAGLVVTERQGTRIVYSLNTSAAEEALSALFDLLGTGGRTSRESQDNREGRNSGNGQEGRTGSSVDGHTTEAIHAPAVGASSHRERPDGQATRDTLPAQQILEREPVGPDRPSEHAGPDRQSEQGR